MFDPNKVQRKYFSPFSYISEDVWQETHNESDPRDTQMRCVSSFLPRIIEGMCQLPQLPFKRRASLTPLLWATVAHRRFSVATGWPRFYGYAVPSAFLPGKRWPEEKRKRHEYVGASQPTAGGSLNQHKQRLVRLIAVRSNQCSSLLSDRLS